MKPRNSSDPVTPIFGKLVASERQKKGLTQAELAKRVEISSGVISQLEMGLIANHQKEMLSKIASVLDISYDLLVAVHVNEKFKPNDSIVDLVKLLSISPENLNDLSIQDIRKVRELANLILEKINVIRDVLNPITNELNDISLNAKESN